MGPAVCVVGARPNYMKMAPLLRAFARTPAMPRPLLVHTGQHYDPMLNDRLFADLDLPAPDLNLEVGSGSHAVQTAEIMRRFEPVIDQHVPSCVIVVGDVNSTLACSVVAVKKGVPVVHVEAGLRSGDRSMPEEINRLLTDQISDLLYTTERTAHANLAREGIAPERIHFVGNLMIDSLTAAMPKAVNIEQTLSAAGYVGTVPRAGEYGVVTLHRPSNVDDPTALHDVLQILAAASDRLPLVWPMHPRTRASIGRHGMGGVFDAARLICLPPQGYLEMLGLLRGARLALTDSGGVQEETTALGVPCLTMRENTERPITIDEGTNELVGRDRARILALVDDVMRTGGKRGRVPELWDGRAASRIAAHLSAWLNAREAVHV